MLRHLLLYLYMIVFGNFSFAQQSDLEKAKLAFEANDFNKSIELSRQFLNKHPSHIEATELLGTSYASLENWGDAKDVYKKLVDAFPSLAEYHFKYGGSLGLYAKNSSKFKAVLLLDEVKFHLKRATVLDPNHIDARWALIQLYMELPAIVGGSKFTASQFAEELTSISPVDAKLAFGYIEEYTGNLENAERYYTQAVEIGNSSICYQKLVDIQLKQNKKKEAISTLKIAFAKTADRNFDKQLKQLIN